MRTTLLCVMLSLVPIGITTDSQPVSLSRFTPRIENLPASCLVAYNAPIEGCSKDDFPAERDEEINNCSAGCVDGLLKIVEMVNQRCMTVRVPADSIIGVALLGNLLPTLCGKIVVVTEQPSVTRVPQQTSSTSARLSSTQEDQSSSTQRVQSSSSPQATPSASASSAPSASDTPQTTERPPTSTTQGLTLDTTIPPPPANQGSVGQKSNPDSGGGSPFDVAIANATPQARIGGYAISALVGITACLIFFL